MSYIIKHKNAKLYFTMTDTGWAWGKTKVKAMKFADVEEALTYCAAEYGIEGDVVIISYGVRVNVYEE